MEETGLILTSLEIQGESSPLHRKIMEQNICALYTADGFTGKMKDCDEGDPGMGEKGGHFWIWISGRVIRSFWGLLKKTLRSFFAEADMRGQTYREAVLDGRIKTAYNFPDISWLYPLRFSMIKFEILTGGNIMAELVKVVVDAMGGGNAPEEPVKAAVEAVKEREDIFVIPPDLKTT